MLDLLMPLLPRAHSSPRPQRGDEAVGVSSDEDWLCLLMNSLP